VPSIKLDDKIAITRLLSAAGANIEQLNIVRRATSVVKGGGLARECHAGKLLTLIISDVLGDSLETIASGPTTPSSTTPRDALGVLEEFGLDDHPEAAPIIDYLRRASAQEGKATAANSTKVSNIILGNNATAVDAAGIEAEARGYSQAMMSATQSDGPAEQVGEDLAVMADQMRREPGPDCLITGGEPVVELANPAVRGKGGRNQQLVLAALRVLGDCRNLALVSGGTDGEDGPTDAAGAFVDEQIALEIQRQGLDTLDYLRRDDAYPLFELVGGLHKTGPTHTNVCDLRVITVSREV
jgi:hydroxypyruvate reductase